MLDLVSRATGIAACGNVRVLLEVSPGDGSAGSLPLVPSLPLHQALGLQNAPDTGTRRGELESLHLLRGVSGYTSVEPEEPAGLTQLEVARGSPPRSFAAVIFPGKKVFGLSVGIEFLRLYVCHLRRFGVLEICIVFLSSAHHCTFSTSHFGRELMPPGLSPVHPPTASSDFNRSFLRRNVGHSELS